MSLSPYNTMDRKRKIVDWGFSEIDAVADREPQISLEKTVDQPRFLTENQQYAPLGYLVYFL
jgi:hypothetical protein